MILTIVIIVSSNCFMEAQAYTEITINRPENDLNFYDGIPLPNGDIIFRFYRPIDKECNEPNLHLKLLHKNGTLTTFDVENFSIPRLNFCQSDPSPYASDNIEIMFIFNKRLHLLYYNISESDTTAPFGRKVLTINLKGKIIR